MRLTLSQRDGLPVYRQIVYQVKHLIAVGRLAPEDELPPVRALAQQLVINPNTVARAYRELEHEGIVFKRPGAGTYVSSEGSPLARRDQKRVLGKLADALLVEARNLGFDLEEVLVLVREHDKALTREGARTMGTPSRNKKRR